MPTNLYDHLINAYAVPQRNRHPVPGRTQSLKIDDQNARDKYPGFCQIVITFDDSETTNFTLKLHNAPYGPEVQATIESRGGQLRANGLSAIITITLSKKDAPFIRKLAKAIRRTTGFTHRYLDPSWKWIRPRTGAALEKLARHVAAYRRTASLATRP